MLSINITVQDFGSVLFNDTLNTFSYGYMASDPKRCVIIYKEYNLRLCYFVYKIQSKLSVLLPLQSV